MAIEIKNLTKKYGSQTVLSSLSLRLEAGEKACLMGASGSGKTTLLSILAGLVKPEGGTVSGVKKGDISMVFQEDRLLEGKDAFSNLSLVLKAKMPLEQMRQEYARIGLADYEGKPVAEFSGGMKRRVAIVRAACAKGSLVLMDEPYKGLDLEAKKQAIRYVLEKTAGRTVLMVTHDRLEAEWMGAKILELESLQG